MDGIEDYEMHCLSFHEMREKTRINMNQLRKRRKEFFLFIEGRKKDKDEI